MHPVLRSYTVAAGIAAGTALLAVLTAWALAACRLAPSQLGVILQLTSAFVLLVGAIGRLGWNIQTWGGSSAPERLNVWLFRGLASIGAYLLFLSVAIEWFK